MSIQHFKHNPRQISKKEHARLEKDLADLGDLGGICHDLDTNSLIGGNQRSEIMGVISGENVPIITERFDPPTKQGTVALGYIEWRGEKYAYRAVKGWSDEQRRRANIEANRAGGAWDVDVLANAWSTPELISIGFDEDWLRDQGKMYGAVLNMLESEKPEPVDAEPQVDRAAELQEKWQVKRGDLWQIGEHLLFCGDSTKNESLFFIDIGESDIAMVFTDPWYNDGIETVVNAVKNTNADYLSLMCTQKQAMAFFTAQDDFSFAFDCVFVQATPNSMMNKAVPYYLHKTLIYAIRNGAKTIFNCDNAKGVFSDAGYFPSVIEYKKPKSDHPLAKDHNAIMKYLSGFSANVIIDLYAGSGTTILACEILGRKCRAIEINPAFVAVALELCKSNGIEVRLVSNAELSA